MTDTPYLILHKVRGEPAFDVAIPIMIGDEEGWIIPTSGHRAYPYRQWELDSLAAGPDEFVYSIPIDMPDDWPDHYTVSSAPRPSHKLTYHEEDELLAEMGFEKKPSNFKRRF